MIEKTTEATIIQYLLEFADQIKKGGDLESHPYGLTMQQWLILLHLANDPNMPFFNQRRNGDPILASELAEFFNVSRANITNLLNVLHEKGLIVQRESSADRRKRLLALTDSGKQTLEQLETPRQAAHNWLFDSFTEAEKTQFLEFLQRCVGQLSKELR